MKTGSRKKRPSIPVPNLCRICLTGGLSMSSLNDLLDSQEGINISKVLEVVMNCWIVSTEKTPNHICMMCLSLLKIAYNLRMQFEETQKKLSIELVKKVDNLTESFKTNNSITETEKQEKSEVELIIGDDNYSLKDLLIVEEEEKPQDFSYFLSKLGTDISAEFVDNKLKTRNNKLTKARQWVSVEDIDSINNEDDLNEDYETIFIQTVSDDESPSAELPLGHEYAKSPNNEYCEISRRGRKSKLPRNMLKKINSFIVEGECNIQKVIENKMNNDDLDETYDKLIDRLSEASESRRRKRQNDLELQEIEKFIICSTDDGSKDNEKIEIENFKQIDSKNEDKSCSEIEIDKSLLNDNMVLEALNSKHVCKHCNMVFATGFGLRRHSINEHKEDNKKRKTNKMSFINDFILKRRLQYARRKLKPTVLLCKVCGHISKSAGGARYHSLTHGERMFPCDRCPTKFFTPSHLKKHIEFKHQKLGTNQHLCPLCGEAKNSHTALSYHLKVHAQVEKKFACTICGLKFLVKSALNNHLRRHKGERRFSCNMCEKAFYTTNELRKHNMTHTGERPLKCNYCEKRFVTKFNRSLHMMTHEGPYMCQYCRKNLIDVDMLTLHMKYKHNIVVKNVSEAVDEEDFDDQEQKYASYQLSIQAPSNTDEEELHEFDLLPKDDILDFEGD